MADVIDRSWNLFRSAVVRTSQIVVAVVLVFVLPLLIATFLWSLNGRRPTVALSCVLGVTTLIAITASFGTWWLPVASAAQLLAFALIRRLPPTGPVRKTMYGLMARVGWVTGAGVLVVAVMTGTPWVPLEQIETTDAPPGFCKITRPSNERVILQTLTQVEIWVSI